MKLTFLNKIFGKIVTCEKWYLNYYHPLLKSSHYSHKALELEVDLWDLQPWNYFQCNFVWSAKGDHAGLKLDLEIWRVQFRLSIYDGRHWNWDANRWYLPH